MAYNKHTWVARQGVGLNKFTDQNGNRYEFTPSPDEVTQPGTPFSAEWMNEMEEQLAKAAVLSGEAVEGNFPVFNALGELVNSGKGPDILQYVNGAFSTLGGASVDVGSAKVETGSYVGTGTPPTLTFSFTPKIVVIMTNGTLNGLSQSFLSYRYESYTFLAILTSNASYVAGMSGPVSPPMSDAVYRLIDESYDSVTINGNTITWGFNEGLRTISMVTKSSYMYMHKITATDYPDYFKHYHACKSGITYHYIAIA